MFRQFLIVIIITKVKVNKGKCGYV